MAIGFPAKNNSDQLKRELMPVLEFFNCPSTGSFAADVAILLGKLGSFAQSFGNTDFMDTYYKLSFAYYDKDGNGTIDREEWKLIVNDMEKLTNTKMTKTADQVFDSIDTNGDGVIDYAEYLVLMQTNDDINKNRQTANSSSNNSSKLTEEQSSAFMESLQCVIEFLGVAKSESIISDLSNISTYVQNKDSKTIAQSIRSRILDSLLGFYVGESDSELVDDEKFALVAIDYADLTGVDDLTGYVHECASRKKQMGTDLTKEKSKEVIRQVDAL